MKATANGYTIALLSVIMVCLLAVPAMAQEEIIWQHSAVIPWDAERLANNNALITEYGNHTIIEVNTTTNEIVWQYGTGTAGSDPGQLNSPVDAERLLNGNTLITDRNNHRVIEVNTTGAIVWQYGTTGTSGSGYNQLNNPMDAERLASGNTLIADRLNDRVIEVNESKGIVWQYGITNPFDADRLPDGNTLIVEYTNHRVIEINPSNEIVWQYGAGTAGSSVNQLNYPMDANRLPDGNTLIADYINDRVIEVRTSDYDLAETDNGFTAASIVWEYVSSHPADAERLSSGSTLICEAGGNRVIEILIAPDLLPTAIVTPPTLYANVSNTISATIKNNGTGVASSLFNVSLSADGSPVDKVEVSGLGAGESTVVSLSWTPSRTGDFELCVIADCDSNVNESNEGNNVLCKNVTVLPFEIDLLPTALETPPTPYANLTNTIRATIKNNGTSDASSLFNISLSADGNPVGEVGVSGLDAGKSVVVNLYWTPSSTGDFELCVAADCNSNINESEEGNNVLCENVTVLSCEHPCWNDSFDDETKIAEKQAVTVHDNGVAIDLDVSWVWGSTASLVDGLGSVSYSSPAIAFDITGDERWNLISGALNGGFFGFYWNGSQWISDPSLISGLTTTNWMSAPAIAFNVTGDGRWNLISGWQNGAIYGFYWNGSQWISDPSLVTGLGCGSEANPAIAFNITGDGEWNLICGNFDGGFRGFYWNGSQWISDSSIVSGLGDIGRYSRPAVAFNITGDGEWNLISGSGYHGWHGYYWNGSQWISDSSLVTGLIFREYSNPAIAFNITGDGRWNLIYGENGGGFYGYQGRYIGTVKSVLIQPSVSYFKNWAVFNANDTIPEGTNITYKILDASNSTITTVVDGQNISGITQTSIRLYAELTTTNISYTPVLHDWSVCWETGEVDLLPTAIETPANLCPNETFKIIAAVKNDGEAHSGRFSTALYANDTEVNTQLIDGIPAGESTNVIFEWTPPQLGNYNLTVIADSDGAITESNETNNSLAKEVTVLPSKVKRLTFDPNSSASPGVAADSEGNIHVVWSDDRDRVKKIDRWVKGQRITVSDIYYKKLAPDGTVLVDDTKLIGFTGILLSAVNPAIAIDSNDNVHIVWENGTWHGIFECSFEGNTFYMKLDNLGNMLIEPKQVISAVYNQPSNPRWLPAKPCGIAIDCGGNVHVVACCNCGPLGHGDRQDIEYVKLDNEGNKLVNYTIEHLTTPGASGTWACMAEPSGIAVDSAGNAYTAYSKGLCGAYGAGITNCLWPSCLESYYVKIDSEGVHKQELTSELPGLPLPSLYPSVCVDSGDNKYVVWSQHNRTATIVGGDSGWRILYGFDFYLTKFDKSDNKVIDRKRLTFEDYPVESGLYDGKYYVRGVRRPIIATESGVIHATWSVPKPKAGENGNIWYMAFDTSGDEIINKTMISIAGGNSWEPDIDACSDGSHLVWTDNKDGNNEIYYVRTVPPPNRVFVLAPADQWTPQNVVATYTIGILSTMSTTETFDLALDNPDRADVELSNSTITIDPNSIGEVRLNVTDSRVGDYLVTVTATSQTNPEIQDSAAITTSVVVPTPDLVITAIDAYHNGTGYSPYFNLSNEVDVKVKNIGTNDAGGCDIGLYADTMQVDTQSVSGLGIGMSETVRFKWTPVGMDCEDDGSPRTYMLKAVADCGDVISESDETNNEITAEETAYWAGYSADEPINAVAWHGVLRGGLNYTTGDGSYTGLYSPGSSVDTHYSITLPSGASVELARLNVYYTWSKDYSTGAYPAMKVSITNTSGTYVVPINASYDDRPCDTPAISYDYPFGNHVFDLTPYITGDGSYTVTVENVGTTGHSFCTAAPGVVILYKDSSKPEREFWILEGADLLEGGRRGGAGNLALSECISNATFAGSIDTGRVETATLGIVSAWGGSAWGADLNSYYWFNDNYLGDGSILGGYSSVYDETVNGMSMLVANAQVGANVSDVTGYITGQDNFASFGDDGDSMMPANAFLVVEYAESEYCREEKPEPAVLVPFMISGSVTNYSDGTQIDNPGVTIKNVNTGEPLPDVETHNDSNYYQVLTSLEKVSCGDVLQFTCDGTRLKHTVRQREVDAGGFVLDIAVGMMPEAIEAGVTFDKKRLDLNSSGILKAFITLPEGYDVADIDASTVECEGALTFGDGSVIPGKQALEVKFKIPDLEDVPTGDAVVLTVTGELYDGTPFEASNTLKVV